MQLVGKHVDSTVNNPIEAVAHWRAGKLRPLCVFDSKRCSTTRTRSPATVVGRHPDLQVAGLDVEYLMLRGIFMPPGVTQDQVDYYVDLFKKVRETPEWKKLMSDGAFNQTFMTGDEYADWVGRSREARTRT